MAESAAYARRTIKGGCALAHIPGGLNAGVTGVVACDDLTTWAGATANGPTRVIVNRVGDATPEEIEVSAVSGNNITIAARGLGNTQDGAHLANCTIEVVSSPRDFDEANQLVNKILGIAGYAVGDILQVSAVAGGVPTFSRLAKGAAWKVPAMNQAATALAYASGYPLFVFADATARDAAITSPTEGMFAWLTGSDVLTYYTGSAWANYTAASGGAKQLGYAEVTATQAAIGTSLTDLTSLTTTVTVGANPIMVTFQGRILKDTADGYVSPAIYDSTGSAIKKQTVVQVTSGKYVYVNISVRLAPAAGSRTYKMQLQAENNTCQLVGTPTDPAFIQVMEIV